MSDIKDKFQLEMERQAKIDEMSRINKARQTLLTNKRTEIEIERLKQNESDLKKLKEIDYGALTAEEIDRLRKSNADYMEAAKEKVPFINAAFNGVVPFFRKNILLIGGKTGDGKSTTVANIISSVFDQKNRKGQPMRCLVLTNEEKSEDVYNRVTCHLRGWSYVNHDKFTEEQKAEFDRMIPLLAADGRLTVIDNNYKGVLGTTTSLEGIRGVFERLIEKQEWYDVVLIDYYQNIKYSKVQPELNEFHVQGLLAHALDTIKNVYPAPIVLLAQVNPNTEADPKPFEFRIKGRKVICDVATFIMEVVANRSQLETNWVIHKSRFNESVGETVVTGFDRGRFVTVNDPKFIKAREEIMSRRESARISSAMRDVSPPEGKGDSDEQSD